MLKGGVQPLLKTLFDVEWKQQPIQQDEVWNQSGLIRKYAVIHGSYVCIQ